MRQPSRTTVWEGFLLSPFALSVLCHNGFAILSTEQARRCSRQGEQKNEHFFVFLQKTLAILEKGAIIKTEHLFGTLVRT
jgi:hypothetical protein